MEEILIANKLFCPNDFASFFFLKTTEFPKLLNLGETKSIFESSLQ